jgi:2-polyprenyl-3-methyl-5-hydroxy-6-metoxy-1,4-benzoquinol methylase
MGSDVSPWCALKWDGFMNDYRARAYNRYRNDRVLDSSRMASTYDRRLTHVIRPEKNWSCLDVACGYGNFLAYLSAKGVSDFVGIDTSEATTRVACRLFGEHRVQRTNAFDYLASHRNCFDLVSALDFIEHMTKDECYELLDKALDALKPNGLLLLRTPNANGLFGMATRYADITHELCFTPTSISDVLSGSGFTVRAIWEDHGRATTALQLFHWVAWHCVRFVIRCVNAAESGSWGDGILTRNMCGSQAVLSCLWNPAVFSASSCHISELIQNPLRSNLYD